LLQNENDYGMASQLEEQLAEEERATNPIGIPECLADMTRRVQQEQGAGRVDNVEALSEDLTGEVQPKAFRLVVYFNKPGSIIRHLG
jgi:hypothetical protein